MKTNNSKRKKLLSNIIVIFLILALPVFVWSLLNLNFNYKKKAASGEPTCIVNGAELIITLVHVESNPTLLNYEISMRNNDSESCSPTTYIMEVNPPTGWIGTFYNNSFSLNPGSSYADNHLVMNVPTGFNDWPQTFTVSYHSTYPDGHVGNQSIVYDANVCIHNPIGLNVSPSLKTGVPGQTLRYDISITNNDFNCDPLLMNLIVDKPSNWTAEFTTPSFTLATNHTYQTTLDITSSNSNYFIGDQPIAVRISTTIGTTDSQTVIYQLNETISKVGDVNNDDKVNMIDIGIVVDEYDSTNPIYTRADVNGNGKVDLIDIGIIIDNYEW